MLLGCVAAAGADGALASPAGGAGAVPAADAAAAAGVAVAGAVVGADTESPPASARGATGAARLVTTDGRGALAGRRRSASTAGATEMGAAVVAPLPLPPPLPVPLPVVLSPKAPMGSPAAMTDRDAWPAVSRVGRRARRRIVRGGGGEGGRGGGGGRNRERGAHPPAAARDRSAATARAVEKDTAVAWHGGGRRGVGAAAEGRGAARRLPDGRGGCGVGRGEGRSQLCSCGAALRASATTKRNKMDGQQFVFAAEVVAARAASVDESALAGRTDAWAFVRTYNGRRTLLFVAIHSDLHMLRRTLPPLTSVPCASLPPPQALSNSPAIFLTSAPSTSARCAFITPPITLPTSPGLVAPTAAIAASTHARVVASSAVEGR